MNLLFVCSRNQWRSPTAEMVFRNYEGLHTRSAGIASSARNRISEKTLWWADLIFVMEKHHREQIEKRFPEIAATKEIVVLDLPDDYGYMDPELIEELKARVQPYLKKAL